MTDDERKQLEEVTGFEFTDDEFIVLGILVDGLRTNDHKSLELSLLQKKELQSIAAAAERLASILDTTSFETLLELNWACNPQMNALMRDIEKERERPSSALMRKWATAARGILANKKPKKKGKRSYSTMNVGLLHEIFRVLSEAEARAGGERVSHQRFAETLFDILPAEARLRLASPEAMLKAVRRRKAAQSGRETLH